MPRDSSPQHCPLSVSLRIFSSEDVEMWNCSLWFLTVSEFLSWYFLPPQHSHQRCLCRQSLVVTGECFCCAVKTRQMLWHVCHPPAGENKAWFLFSYPIWGLRFLRKKRLPNLVLFQFLNWYIGVKVQLQFFCKQNSGGRMLHQCVWFQIESCRSTSKRHLMQQHWLLVWRFTDPLSSAF